MTMFHPCITHFLIGIVLVCPYFCLGEEVNGDVLRAPGESCRGQCETCDSEHETPSSPAECDPDCLCHGAVLDHAKIETPTSGDKLVVIAILCVLVDTFVDSRPSVASPRGCHFPSGSTGRDVCALKCALLL
jgi:hypothetical protein